MACGEMKKKEEGLTFVCAGGDSCNVELLHDDEQHRDGDGDQHAACTEQGKVIVDQRAREHVVQANRDGPVGADRELRAMCADDLPEYVLPVGYKFIDKLPLTPVGKVDYLALEAQVTPQDY